MDKLITPPEKKFSWTAELLKLEVDGQPLMANINARNTISPLISNTIKGRHPERAFKTKKVTIDKKDFLKVWRTR